MITSIFTEFLNIINNKMRRQNHHILLFLDNCSLHLHISLSNVKLCFYPKNTTVKLQAMDQGVIVTLQKKYNKQMLNLARIKVKTAQGVADIIKDVKIFDAIINVKVAWEAIDPETIIKCFKCTGGHYDYGDLNSPPITPDTTMAEDDDPEFASYFQELLNIPWDEYLGMDEELHEFPAWAPTTETSQ